MLRISAFWYHPLPFFCRFFLVFSISFLLQQTYSCSQNISKADSLSTLLHTVLDDSLRIEIYNGLSTETQYSFPDTSVYYARCALTIAPKTANTKGIAISQNQIGIYYKGKNNFDSALIYYRTSLENFVKIDYKKGVAALHNNIGTIHHTQQDFEMALHDFYKAIGIFEQIGDKNGVAATLSNISMVFRMEGKWQDAINNYKKALEINMEIGNEYAAEICLTNIGSIYEDRKFYDSALAFYQKALAISKQTESKQGIATDLCYIGNIYHAMGENDSARRYQLSALEIMDSLNDKKGISLVLYNLGDVYRELSNPAEAISCFSKSLQIATELNDMEILKSDYWGLSEVYKSIGNYLSAYNYLQLYAQTEDTISRRLNSKQIAEMQTRYETQKKQQEIERQQSIIEKRNYQIYTVMTILLLLALTGAFIILQLRTKTKKRAIELQQKLLRTQMNPHFIFNALTSIQGSVLEKNPDEAADYISKFAALMRLILESSKEEYIPLNMEIKILNYYLELQQLRYDGVFEFSIKVLPPNDGEDLGGVSIPPMLAQPFIENAIEHGIVKKCAKGFIDVWFEILGNEIVFTVENYCTTPNPRLPEEDLYEQGALQEQWESNELAHKPMAVAITTERLRYLNRGQREKIKLEFTEGEKTRVSFTIPLKP